MQRGTARSPLFKKTCAVRRSGKRWSGKRGSNSRPPPWQGGALPLSYFRILRRRHPSINGYYSNKKLPILSRKFYKMRYKRKIASFIVASFCQRKIVFLLYQEVRFYYDSPRSQARRAQTDWVTFIKGGAQYPQGGRLCV